MKKLLSLLIITAALAHANGQNCPTISSECKYRIDDSTWAWSVGYTATGPSSLQFTILSPTPSTFCVGVDGTGAYTYTVTGKANISPIGFAAINAGSTCDTSQPCSVNLLLASEPVIKYAGGSIYFTGDLYLGKRWITNVSPYKPAYIGDYKAFDNAWSKVVYVPFVGNPSSYRVFDSIGRFIKVETVPANSMLRKEPGFFYVAIAKK